MSRLPSLSAGRVGAGKSRLVFNRRLVLWYAIFAFIICFWLLQISYNSNGSTNVDNKASSAVIPAVNFVESKKTLRINNYNKTIRRQFKHDNVNNYENDYYREKIEFINRTAAEYEMGLDVNGDMEPLWCYIEGSLAKTKTELDIWNIPQQHCTCAPGWHGKDCGQPEIIYRALMAYNRKSSSGSLTLQLRDARPGVLHRLYYIIELSYISWEFLELQLNSVIDVVDCYLIYYVSHSKYNRIAKKSLEYGLATMLANTSYLLYHCQQWRTNCSVSLAYKYFRKQLSNEIGIPMKSTDLILYSNVPAIFASYALKFLKYYAIDVLPVHFRLKHNVYGFYWQHPQQTQVNGVISSLIHLNNPHLGRSDPLRLLLTLPMAPSLTIGDLNHYGGWYCEYCLQPDEIVELLQTTIPPKSVNSSSKIKFPKNSRSQHIDATYIQQLIAHGMHLDGMTNLQKLRRYADRYYAPKYAEIHNTKYSHLLVNFYETLDDIDEDENGVY